MESIGELEKQLNCRVTNCRYPVSTVHNGYSDNGGARGFLANLSLYQYITISIITITMITVSILSLDPIIYALPNYVYIFLINNCSIISSLRITNFSFRRPLVTIYVYHMECKLSGKKKGQKQQFSNIIWCTNYHYIQ